MNRWSWSSFVNHSSSACIAKNASLAEVWLTLTVCVLRSLLGRRWCGVWIRFAISEAIRRSTMLKLGDRLQVIKQIKRLPGNKTQLPREQSGFYDLLSKYIGLKRSMRFKDYLLYNSLLRFFVLKFFFCKKSYPRASNPSTAFRFLSQRKHNQPAHIMCCLRYLPNPMTLAM